MSREPFYYNRLVEKADYTFDAPGQQFKLLRKESNTFQYVSSDYLDYQFGKNYLPECYGPQPGRRNIGQRNELAGCRSVF